MGDREQVRANLIKMVRKVIAGEITDIRTMSEFATRFENEVPDPALEKLWHQTMHYVSDIDIRRRDAAYNEARTASLEELIRNIDHPS